MKPRELIDAICAIVHFSHQQPHVYHQVTLDPEKVKDNFIRIGDYPGDEYCGWQPLEAITIHVELGIVDLEAKTVTPREQKAAA